MECRVPRATLVCKVLRETRVMLVFAALQVLLASPVLLVLKVLLAKEVQSDQWAVVVSKARKGRLERWALVAQQEMLELVVSGVLKAFVVSKATQALVDLVATKASRVLVVLQDSQACGGFLVSQESWDHRALWVFVAREVFLVNVA